MKNKKETIVIFRLTEEEKKKIKYLAKSEHRTMSNYILWQLLYKNTKL